MIIHLPHWLPLLFCSVACLASVQSSLGVAAASSAEYSAISDASLCIRSNFTQTYSTITGDIRCAIKCSETDRCQAFTTADGACQLFVFNECSKSVRDCSCTRRGLVFVKQQPGVPAGALCPSGYGDDLCGVKYRLYSNTGTWSQSRQKCDSDSGLVIMADVVDAAEMSYIETLYAKYTSSSVWFGGFQAPGSAEPAGGWCWVGCNTTLDGSLWASAEPSNSGGVENAVDRHYDKPGLNDKYELTAETHGVLCECVSPFQ